MNKNPVINFGLNPSFKTTVKTDIVVWSHDSESYVIEFNFSDYLCNKPFDLTDSVQRIMLEFLNSDEAEPQIYKLEVDSNKLGIATFTIPENILGYIGKVKASITIDFKDKTHDLGNFIFNMEKSSIDQKLPQLTFYVDEFSKALEKFDELEEKIERNDLVTHPELKESTDKTNKKIADLSNNYELNKLDVDKELEDIRKEIAANQVSGGSGNQVLVESFGAKGDGRTDDTKAINDAIKYAYDNKLSDVVFADKTYMIKAHVDHDNFIFYLMNEGGIQLKDNVNLIMSNNTILRAISTSARAYNIIQAWGTKNHIISGGRIEGTIGRHPEIPLNGKKDECGYGIALNAAQNVLIENVHIEKCWGDGIDLQGVEVSGKWQVNRNIVLNNVICDLNRRQGMSLELVDGMRIYKSKFTNTGKIKATAPSAGVDIEPWDLDYTTKDVYVKDVKFYDCEFSGNSAQGVIVMGKSVSDIEFINCTTKDNTSTEILVHTGVKNILFDNLKAVRTLKGGAGLVLDSVEDATVKNSYFEDCIPVLTELNGDLKGSILYENNDIVLGKNFETEEAILLNVPKNKGAGTIKYSKNRVEYLRNIKSSNVIFINVEGNNAVYEDNKFINLRSAFVISGSKNTFINNTIHNTLFDAITNSGEGNEFIENTLSGTGGYVSIKTMPNVSSVTAINNTIIEKQLIPFPNGTYGERHKTHNLQPAISVGVPSPEDPPFIGTKPTKFSILVSGNKRISDKSMNVPDVTLSDAILASNYAESVVLDQSHSFNVGVSNQRPKNAVKGDQFFNEASKEYQVCTKSAFYLETGALVEEAEWMVINGSGGTPGGNNNITFERIDSV